MLIPAMQPRRRARDGAGRLGWWMMAPALAMLAANSIFPLLYAVTVSFKNYQILIPVPHRWVGFANYGKIFSDHLFWSSLGVTMWFLAGVVFLQFPLGMGWRCCSIGCAASRTCW